MTIDNNHSMSFTEMQTALNAHYYLDTSLLRHRVRHPIIAFFKHFGCYSHYQISAVAEAILQKFDYTIGERQLYDMNALIRNARALQEFDSAIKVLQYLCRAPEIRPAILTRLTPALILQNKIRACLRGFCLLRSRYLCRKLSAGLVLPSQILNFNINRVLGSRAVQCLCREILILQKHGKTIHALTTGISHLFYDSIQKKTEMLFTHWSGWIKKKGKEKYTIQLHLPGKTGGRYKIIQRSLRFEISPLDKNKKRETTFLPTVAAQARSTSNNIDYKVFQRGIKEHRIIFDLCRRCRQIADPPIEVVEYTNSSGKKIVEIIQTWYQGSLADLIRTDSVYEGIEQEATIPVSLSLKLGILQEIAAQLDELHGNYKIHGDISPGNILIRMPHGYLNDYDLANRFGKGRGSGKQETLWPLCTSLGWSMPIRDNYALLMALALIALGSKLLAFIEKRSFDGSSFAAYVIRALFTHAQKRLAQEDRKEASDQIGEMASNAPETSLLFSFLESLPQTPNIKTLICELCFMQSVADALPIYMEQDQKLYNKLSSDKAFAYILQHGNLRALAEMNLYIPSSAAISLYLQKAITAIQKGEADHDFMMPGLSAELLPGAPRSPRSFA